MTEDEEIGYQIRIDTMKNVLTSILVTRIDLLAVVHKGIARAKQILTIERRYPDILCDKLKAIIQGLVDNADKIPTMSKDIFQNIPGIQSIERSIESLLARGYIDQKEYDRLKQMCWASYEDLVIALEITYNLCKKHSLLNARLKNCKLIPPPENIFE